MILNLCTTVTGAKIEYNNFNPEEFLKSLWKLTTFR